MNIYSELLEILKMLLRKSRLYSQAAKRHEARIAEDYIKGSKLPEDEKKILIAAIRGETSAFRDYIESNGIQIVIDILEEYQLVAA